MSKPALLFLHYFGGSGRTWTPVTDILSDAFTCLTPDLPGWGHSQAPPAPQVWGEEIIESRTVTPIPQGRERSRENSLALPPPKLGGPGGPFSVDAAVRFALSQIEMLGGGPFALIGHSMGGKVAQAVAAARPPGLRALILVAPSPAVPEPMTDADRAKLRAAWGSGREARRIVDSITFRPLPPLWHALAVEDTLRASREAWQAWTDSGSREDISPRMAQITVPTRIFAGEHDSPLTPDYLAREVAARIAGADVVTVPGTKHLLPLEAPQELADSIRQFVTPLFP